MARDAGFKRSVIKHGTAKHGVLRHSMVVAEGRWALLHVRRQTIRPSEGRRRRSKRGWWTSRAMGKAIVVEEQYNQKGPEAAFRRRWPLDSRHGQKMLGNCQGAEGEEEIEIQHMGSLSIGPRSKPRLARHRCSWRDSAGPDGHWLSVSWREVASSSVSDPNGESWGRVSGPEIQFPRKGDG